MKLIRNILWKDIRALQNGIANRKKSVLSMKNIRTFTSLPHTEDRYGGLHIQIPKLSAKSIQYEKELNDNMKRWKEMGCSSVWLEVPIQASAWIPAAARLGFSFHHAEGDTAVLCQWMHPHQTNLLPRYATHQVGVAGCVVREDTGEVLMVKDKHRKHSMWKFPGGLSDLGEDIALTAEREVFEEAGVKSKFEGILVFRQQHNQPGAFGRSDLYFICRMSPLTFELNPCQHEIEACDWLSVNHMIKDPSNSAITLRVLQLISKGLQEGFSTVETRAEVFKSIYKGRTYELFSRNMDGEIGTYASNVADESLLKSTAGEKAS